MMSKIAIIPPFGRIILPILGIILTIHPFIHAMPLKTLLDLDISGPLPSMVEVIPSEAYPGGIHYTIKKSSRHMCMLGAVRDGQDVLIEGDSTAMTRHVLVQDRRDGMKYVKVTTRWRMDGKYTTRVEEFMRGHMDGHYGPIIRALLEVDVPTQENDHLIRVEVMAGEDGHPSEVFSVQPEVEAVIGVVKYDNYILEDRQDGLMSREVIWEGGLERPKITITSRYADGTEVETKYKFFYSHKGFRALRSTKKFVALQE